MRERYCIAFAGVPGSSKTPIAHYLSEQFGLPIFCSDAIRTEVKEDKGWFDIPEFDRRRTARLRDLVSCGRSFIHDGSLDRQWDTFKAELSRSGYEEFAISIDLSRRFLENLYTAKGYVTEEIDQYLADHEQFLNNYNRAIGLHITDKDFSDRLQLAAEAVKKWLTKEET